jgi:protein-tyrosine phosphatase
MSERLLALHLRKHLGDRADDYYYNHGAGTGSWHVGEPMNSPAARELLARGGDPVGFKARKLRGDMIDSSDLVLCATSEQVEYAVQLRPDAAGKIFVIGEFGRLMAQVNLSRLPTNDGSPDGAYDRGHALVVATDAVRGGGAVWGGDGRREPSRVSDDLDDPWGLAPAEFARVADEIEATVVPLAAALTG